MERHDIYTLLFNGRLGQEEITKFRGAIIKALEGTGGCLTHNHDDDGVIYTYPAVQYKIIDSSPAIVCIDREASDVARKLHNEFVWHLDIGRSCREFSPESLNIQSYIPSTDLLFSHFYTIDRYIPLTGHNAQKFEEFTALTDKICFIENILTGNILSFYKGLDFFAEDEIHVAITDIYEKRTIRYKNVNFLTFRLSFVTNAFLPDNIGLGKSASVGFGVIKLDKSVKHA